MIATADEFAGIRRQAEAEYPHECCGVILAKAGAREDRIPFPCRNIQNEKHAEDPVQFPRDARTAYYADPRDVVRFVRLESEGYAVVTFYHSHIDAGAYFSETDKRQAAPRGEPLYPDATYLILSVVDRKVVDARAFRWDPTERDFLPLPFGEP